MKLMLYWNICMYWTNPILMITSSCRKFLIQQYNYTCCYISCWFINVYNTNNLMLVYFERVLYANVAYSLLNKLIQFSNVVHTTHHCLDFMVWYIFKYTVSKSNLGQLLFTSIFTFKRKQPSYTSQKSYKLYFLMKVLFVELTSKKYIKIFFWL